MRIYRLLEYDGPEDWIAKTFEKSIQGTLKLGSDRRITALTMPCAGCVPEEVVEEMLVRVRPGGPEACPKK